MTHSFFKPQKEQLESLSAELAVEFFRDLLIAEAGRMKLPLNKIQVPLNIYSPDGGLDGNSSLPEGFLRLNHIGKQFDEGVLRPGLVGYQVKSGKLTPAGAAKELYVKGKKVLKPAIKALLDSKGIYVLVQFESLVGQARKRRIEAIQNVLIDEGYDKDQVDVLSVTELLNYAEHHPSIVLDILGKPGSCRNFKRWSNEGNISVPKNFVPDDHREQSIKSLRDVLLSEHPRPIRITGLSGVGKTRLVFEALSIPELSSGVVYFSTDSGDAFQIVNYVAQNHNIHGIFVIDECSPEVHDRYVSILHSHHDRVKLITISNDQSRVQGSDPFIFVEKLGLEKTEELVHLEHPSLPDEVVKHIAAFTEGFPKMADLVAESYGAPGVGPSELIEMPGDALFQRILTGPYDYNSDYGQKILDVMSFLSIFEKIGASGVPHRECDWLMGYLGLTKPIFSRIVREQQEKGLLRGEYYLHVTPHMIRIYLMRRAWGLIGMTYESFEQFVDGIPEEFRDSLKERLLTQIPYLRFSPEGEEFVNELLSKDGPFADGSAFETELGTSFFFKLTMVNPNAALTRLQETVGSWSDERLIEKASNLQSIVHSLEEIALYADCFSGAVDILLKLARHEKSPYANNAQGTLVGLFTPAPGSISLTSVNLYDRFDVLKRLVENIDVEDSSILFRVFEAALSTGTYTGVVKQNVAYGIVKPDRWIPSNTEEYIFWYKSLWKLLFENLSVFALEDVNKIAENIFMRKAYFIAGVPDFLDGVFGDLKSLIERSILDKSFVAQECSRVLKYQHDLPEEILEAYGSLMDSLYPDSLEGRLEKYVSQNFDAFPGIPDFSAEIKKIASEIVEKPEFLIASGNAWLFTGKAKSGFEFGACLASFDTDGHILFDLILNETIKAFEERSCIILAGYLSHFFQENVVLWVSMMKKIGAEQDLAPMLTELSWRSGLNDEILDLLLEKWEEGVLELDSFLSFKVGSRYESLSHDKFMEFISKLLTKGGKLGIQLGFDFAYSYFFYPEPSKNVPVDLVYDLLTNEFISGFSTDVSKLRSVEYQWSRMANWLLEKYPEKGLDLLKFSLANLEEMAIFDSMNDRAFESLSKILRQFPKEGWIEITKYLGPPLNFRSMRLRDWLGGADYFQSSSGIIDEIDPNDFWHWVDEDIENRAWWAAGIVPSELLRRSHGICWAREVLVRYGDRDDVKRNLLGNFETEGWSGPSSEHHQRKKENLTNFLENEKNKLVIEWVQEYISYLNRRIKEDKADEELRGF